jgi:hypothetical protein
MNLPEIKNSEVVVFKPKDGRTEFQVIIDGDENTVWATEQQIMELFGKARRTVGEHIKNIYEEGELDQESTWREFRQVQKEGERKINDNTLVTIALTVAQSLPEQRETIQKLVMNLIKN